MDLTLDERTFCDHIVSGLSPLHAYCATFDHVFLSDEKLRQKINGIMKRKQVKERIRELKEKVSINTIMDGSRVVKEWIEIATTDVNEIVQYQRNNCRYCWGIDHHFQWTVMREFADALAVVITQNAEIEQIHEKRGQSAKDLKLPNDDGGYGFVPYREPNQRCPKCHGEGEPRVHIMDTRRMSDAAKKLYMGVKRTRYGDEIILRDKDTALANLAKYFKVLTQDEPDSNNLTIKVIGGLPE